MARVSDSRLTFTLYVSANKGSKEERVLVQIARVVRRRFPGVQLINPEDGVNVLLGPFTDHGIANAICVFVNQAKEGAQESIVAQLEQHLAALVLDA